MESSSATAEVIDHPLLEPGVIDRREYQIDIAERARDTHTLVCLPTGLGKTTISLLVTATRLEAGDGKSLMLAPTKPLVSQHADFYRKALTLPDEEIVTYTGETAPADRETLWADARVIIATPQVVENDLIGDRIDLTDVVHLTIDECHRTGGNYPYEFIADVYHDVAAEPLVTGMSASPGSNREEIIGVCKRLGISAIQVRTPDDSSVEPYTHDTSIEPIEVELPEEIRTIRDNLRSVVESRLESLVELGVSDTSSADCSQSDIDAIRARLQGRLESGDQSAYQGLSYHAEIMKLRNALRNVETQSVGALNRYFERRLEAARSSGASKADQRLVSDPRVRKSIELAREFDDLHPKFRQTRILLAETLGVKGGSRVLVFTESRDTAEELASFLGNHFDVRRFVGQTDKRGSEGMSQDEQHSTIEAFRQGEFEVLVSTSVGEEGLDVPEVDLVLFFEPVPTAIRSIQRRGRTGRQAPGRVVVLIAKDTLDEAYYWKSYHSERSMEEDIKALADIADDIEGALHDDDTLRERAEAAKRRAANQRSLWDDFGGKETDPEPDDDTSTVTVEEEAEASIIIDQRELDSAIARELTKMPSIATSLETLDVGDYVLSDRVAVERKTVNDFLDSLLGGDRNLFEQIGRLVEAYERPVVIIEGDRLYDRRNVRPEAVRGALASLTVDFGASVLQTNDSSETCALLASIALREHRNERGPASAHGEKGGRTKAEQQEYVVSSIAEIGPVTARALLESFGSVEAVMTASKEELLEIEGIGEITAERILEVVTSPYEPE